MPNLQSLELNIAEYMAQNYSSSSLIWQHFCHPQSATISGNIFFCPFFFFISLSHSSVHVEQKNHSAENQILNNLNLNIPRVELSSTLNFSDFLILHQGVLSAAKIFCFMTSCKLYEKLPLGHLEGILTFWTSKSIPSSRVKHSNSLNDIWPYGNSGRLTC